MLNRTGWMLGGGASRGRIGNYDRLPGDASALLNLFPERFPVYGHTPLKLNRNVLVTRLTACPLVFLVWIVSLSAGLVRGETGKPSEGGIVAGRVVDSRGEPAGGSRVTLVEFKRWTTTDKEGLFRFTGLPAGFFHLQALSRKQGSGVSEFVLEEQGSVQVEIVLSIEVHQEDVVVTSTTRGRGVGESYTPSSSISRTELTYKMQPTLGETLSAEPGVNASSFAPGSSRPVIRGQTAGRIRILESGVGTGDASATSPDHAVATDPLGAERIEVVRGAGTLLYGSTALGGVVNIIDERVPTHRSAEPLEGEFNTILGSVNDEISGALAVDGGAGSFAWHMDASHRQTGDYDIPGPAVAGDAESPQGTLPNSALESDMITAGASWVGDDGFVGMAIRGFDSLYGIPAEPEGAISDPNGPLLPAEEGVQIDLQQRRVDVRGGFTTPFGTFDGVNFTVGAADYQHRELEGGEVSTVFENEFLESRVELPHSQGAHYNGVIGGQFAARDMAVAGEEAFLPDSSTQGSALFALQEFAFEPVSMEVGLRLEHSSLDAVGEAGRDFTSLSASAGIIWELNPRYSLGGTISRTERAPGVEELYADGPHLATLTFELGDPDLTEETAMGMDVVFRRRVGAVTGSLGVFAIDYDDYIFTAPTGAVADDLPVFQVQQADARFMGGEFALTIELIEKPAHDFHLELMADYVEAELKGSGENLPFIPPLRMGARLHYRGNHWHASSGVMVHRHQDEIAPFETPTAGYTLVEAKVGYRFAPAKNTIHEVTLRGANLGDVLARNHISRLKESVPLPGRNISLVYRLVF